MQTDEQNMDTVVNDVIAKLDRLTPDQFYRLILDVCEAYLEKSNTISLAHAAGGCYCRECKYQEDCDGWVTQSYRDHILEQTVYKHCKLEWCSYGEKEDAK